MKKKEDLTNHLDIGTLLAIVWKRKWLVVLPMILVGGLAFGGSYLLTPEFESSAIIQIDAKTQLIGELQRLVGQGNRRQNFAEQRDRLRSIYNEIVSLRYTSLLNDRLHLTNQQHIETRARQYVAQQPSMSLERARLIVLQSELKKNLSVSWASGDQIRLTVLSVDPVRARDLANTLGDVFIKEKVKEELHQIRSSQNFSDLQLEKYEKQLGVLVQKKTDLEKELISLQLDEAISSESNRQDISSEIDNTQEEITGLRDREQQLLSQLRPFSGIDVRHLKLQDSKANKAFKRDLKEQLRQIGDLMIKYSWSDPQIISFKLKLNGLLESIYKENGRLVDQQFASVDRGARSILKDLFNTQTQLNHLYSKKPYLESALDNLAAKVKIIPEKQAVLDQIKKEIAATTDIRDRFKRQQESSTISQALVQDMSSTKYRIVEPAKIALAPFAPNRRKIVVMGIVLGFVLGGMAILLMELLDKSFKTVDDIEEWLGLPVLGIVPRIDGIKKL